MKRPLIVTLASLAAFALGVLALVSAIIGFSGRGNATDAATTAPNLIIGLASLAGAIGYWLLKKWGHYIYAVAVIAQLLNHAVLFLSYLSSGRANISGGFFLLAIPAIPVVILVSMELQRRKDVLS